MAGKSPVTADAEKRSALVALSHSRDRGEADRARAILLTLSGWTSRQIAEAFGVREDTVRFWRSAFTTGGIEALKTSVAPGPAPVKAERALAVAEEVLSAPVADRPNWTLPRLADELEKRSGMRISRSRLSVVLRQRGISAGDGPAAGWSRLTRHIQDRLTVSRRGSTDLSEYKGHSSQARWPDRSGLAEGRQCPAETRDEAVRVPELWPASLLREPKVREVRAPTRLSSGSEHAFRAGGRRAALASARLADLAPSVLRQCGVRRLQLACSDPLTGNLLPGVPPQPRHP